MTCEGFSCWCFLRCCVVKRWVVLSSLVCIGLSAPAEAQRHPESGGPLPYYDPTPGTPQDPPWKKAPPFSARSPRSLVTGGWGGLFSMPQLASPISTTPTKSTLRTTARRLLGPPHRVARREPATWVGTGWGNYMGGGYHRFLTIEESRSGSDFSGYSYIDHKYRSFRVGHYTHKDLHWTATLGNVGSPGGGTDVRTIFTPLTLVNSKLDALRMDLNYKERDRATLLYSRGGNHSGAQLFSKWAFGPRRRRRLGQFTSNTLRRSLPARSRSLCQRWRDASQPDHGFASAVALQYLARRLAL